MKERAIWFTVFILFMYFAFTSGFVYWVTNESETTKIVTPFSWALSAKDKGLTGIATKNDMDCVEYLLNETPSNKYIVADSNGLFLISGYHELLPDTWLQYGREDRLLIFMELPKQDNCYLFLTTWNTENMKYITCSDVGLRRQNEFSIDGNILTYEVHKIDEPWEIIIEQTRIKPVYWSGNSRVYNVIANYSVNKDF